MIRFVAAFFLVVFPLNAASAGTVTVRHGDLDLSNPLDVLILKERVLQAAEAVCLPSSLPNYGITARILSKVRTEQRGCVREASERALARILGKTGLA